ncbi:Os09g0409736 [Oryza sativa Japonica Group]|uniref:Os09g0409736 protein n=2 Tax=Oryza sativa subsp. japonica TaxID=39947 RepID=Q69NE2_ORYSJ|nr:hypothetical protein [Oryza sativa Japonica Group]BAT08036.1 Os09g0409736 [Oryza sativa Japonica Group]
MPPSSPCRSLSVLMLQHNPMLGDIPNGFLLGRAASFSRARTAGELFPCARTAGELLPRARSAGEILPAQGRLARSSPRGAGRQILPMRGRPTRPSPREDGRRDPPHAWTAGNLEGLPRPPRPPLRRCPGASRFLCVLEPGRSPACGVSSRRARPPCAVVAVAALLIEGERRKI